MLYTSLNFSIYVTHFDPAYFRLESTSLFFIQILLFPFSFPREICPTITDTISFASTVLDLSVGCAK